MKNIILAGLPYVTNLGDRAIFMTTKQIVASYYREKGMEVEIREIDLEGVIDKNSRYNQASDIFKKIKRRHDIAHYRGDELRIKNVEYLCSEMMDKETLGVVFVGGGVLKYRYQLLFKSSIDVITAFADRKKIPVMFSAVGVEGYDGSNENCLTLKKAINRSCVKYITVRDDIDLLNDYYIENRDIFTVKVSDPAINLNKLIPAEHQNNHTIGLGIIRGDLFLDNDIDFREDDLRKLYGEIYEAIRKAGYNCEIFTNGIGRDVAFGERLIPYIEENYGEKAVMLERPTDLKQLVEQINRFDGIICGRLHGSILAYSYDIVSVGLVWNNKQNLFGATIGYPERFVDVKKVTGQQVVDILLKGMQEGYAHIDKESYGALAEIYIREFLDKYSS